MGRGERNMQVKLTLLIPLLALPLGGCPSATIGSVVGGECRLVRTPVYAVKGKTAYDDEWIQDTEEALVRGCKQARPKARPASLDAPQAKPSAANTTTPVKKKHWWQR